MCRKQLNVASATNITFANLTQLLARSAIELLDLAAIYVLAVHKQTFGCAHILAASYLKYVYIHVCTLEINLFGNLAAR